MRYSQTRRLLGTLIEITVISEDNNTPLHIESVFDYFASVEEEFSRFRPESSLSLLNTQKKMPVSKRFLELLEISRNMYRETGGLFNPLVSVAALGYSHSFDDSHFEKVNEEVNTDFDALQIEENIVTLQAGQSLDFGGIAKGWAVDQASSLLSLFGYENFFVNAGGDIYASGKNDEGDNGWLIGIESPFTEDIVASVLLQDQAIASSGSYKRKWNIAEKKYHHLINPRTGQNENGIQSVSLIASNCTNADGFTKSIFNAPIQEGLRLIEQNGMEGLIFTTSKKVLSTKGLKEKYNLTFSEEIFSEFNS